MPEDLSLISFDDTPVVRFSHPPLTAIVQPIAEVTSRAVQAIIADLAGQDADPIPIVVPAMLAQRHSTGPASM